MEIGRVIRTPNERTGGDMEKSFSACNVAVVIELVGADVQSVGPVAHKGSKGGFDLTAGAGIDDLNLQSDRVRGFR